VNVKTEEQLKRCIAAAGWRIEGVRWRASHFPIWRWAELALGFLPRIGPCFRRRIVLQAVPNSR
jgi:hypothetical protein